MSNMWKPGTSKPKDTPEQTASANQKTRRRAKETTNKNSSNDGHPAATATNGSSTSAGGTPRKKLSGATMGMRFMQRKMEAEQERKNALEEKKQQDQMEWTATEQQDNTSREGNDHDEPRSAVAAATTTTLPQAATGSDMYGEKSDLIGRRSFGGFRPHVGESYKSACATWEKDIGNSANDDKKKHISDEELLRRYKNHVSGKGDMMDTSAPSPVGNLQNKLRKGKRKHQSPQKGEKRKR